MEIGELAAEKFNKYKWSLNILFETKIFAIFIYFVASLSVPIIKFYNFRSNFYLYFYWKKIIR